MFLKFGLLFSRQKFKKTLTPEKIEMDKRKIFIIEEKMGSMDNSINIFTLSMEQRIFV
jgi:hypothetical protein